MKTTLIYLHCVWATVLVNSASAAGRVFHEDFETGTLDWGKDCPAVGDHKWHRIEIYVKHDTDGQDGIIRHGVDGVKIHERLGATDNDGGKWYPWHIMSNWSSNPGWEHDANNHTYWDDIEIFSDTGKGEVTGSMADATIRVAANQPTGGRTPFLPGAKAEASKEPEQLLLKDYRPRSIYNTPQTKITRAKFPVIDLHAHDHGKSDAELAQWVKTMDELNIQKTVILSQAHGKEFDEIVARYQKYPGRFSVWCAFDYTGYDQPGYGLAAVAELERCFKAGAEGVGEMGDKGKGMFFTEPAGWGMHFDDPRMDPLLAKCGELGMPISIHVADPKWMYEPMDKSNDGLMNAYNWRLDNQTNNLGHAELLATLENAVRKHPKTTFVACHVANCCYDLSKLGALFDKYPNLYADISARYAEMAPIPRTVRKFFEKYPDRLVYGTDMGRHPNMYRTTFRILETDDEHFYEWSMFSYHWPLHGLALPDEVLRKVYSGNAQSILQKLSR